ncbi:MAG: sulfatase-like hydrolase/transferase, partial [Planctomycetes bacterium]|nr:sulfatase-like hydrolase/transferase [Planctomycetota bacterium]
MASLMRWASQCTSAGCRGPATSQGYYGDEAANRQLYTADGWMLTGDTATLDADGVLRVVGRKADFIIRGGKNISGPAVEEAAGSHPAVALAAAVPMPDPVFGERVCLYAELRAGASLTLEELVKHFENMFGPMTEEMICKGIAGHHCLMKMVDDCLGTLMDTVRELGLLDNTLIIYTSDHGTMLGGHNYLGKELPYNEATGVPFLVRWPGRIPAGSQLASPFGSPDIFPTLAGLAELPAPAGVDGRDLSGELLGEPGAPT